MTKITHATMKRMLREQYESKVYSVLIETELKEKEIMDAAGLEVTRKRDGNGGKKGDKCTIHSVEKRADGRVVVRLISPENITGPITMQSIGASQPTQEYTLEDFESNFEV
jgi:hypothetical protein